MPSRQPRGARSALLRRALLLGLLLPVTQALAGAQPPGTPARSGGPSRAPGAEPNAGPARRGTTSATPAASSEEQSPRSEEDFGRWERSARQCEIRIEERQDRPPQQFPCRGVRLDQQLAGLLSIRFLPATQDRSTPTPLLLFAGVLQPGSQPMRCRDSRCQPSWPIRVQLSALASINANTPGLPQARVVQGSCNLERERLLCTARNLEGSRWQARVRW